MSCVGLHRIFAFAVLGAVCTEIRLNYRLWCLTNFSSAIRRCQNNVQRAFNWHRFGSPRCNTLRLLNAITSNKNHIYKHTLCLRAAPSVLLQYKITTVYSTSHAPNESDDDTFWSDKIGTQLSQAATHTFMFAPEYYFASRLIYSIAELSRLHSHCLVYILEDIYFVRWFDIKFTCSQLWTVNRFNLRHLHSFRIGFACERERSCRFDDDVMMKMQTES